MDLYSPTSLSIRIQDFEGPFDLLYYLIEKNKVDIYDIPISDIADQYIDLLFSMKSFDMEIASEFLIMASTLLHIKSKLMLPTREEQQEEEELDPREELVMRLLEYKRYKEISIKFKARWDIWSKAFYSFPEGIKMKTKPAIVEMDSNILLEAYTDLLNRQKNKINVKSKRIGRIVGFDKFKVKDKIKEIVTILREKSSFIFSTKHRKHARNKAEIVTEFLAILELAKFKKVKLKQKKMFDDIEITKNEKSLIELDFDKLDTYG